MTNVVRERPRGNDISIWIPDTKKGVTREHSAVVRDRFVAPVVEEGYRVLMGEIERVKPEVIIALGNVALWALTGRWGVKNWRGSMLDGPNGERVVPTYHPVAILRQWSLRAVTLHDLRRAVKEAGTRSVPPSTNFILRPLYHTVLSTLNDLLTRLNSTPLLLSLDIETSYGHIMCLGLAWSRTDALCIPFVEIQRGGAAYWPEHEEAEIVFMLYKILTHPNCRVVWQNGLFDSQYIYRAWHFVPRHHFDTMIGQHSCFSTMPKSLDFISSMYADFHVYWKGIARGLDQSHGVKKDD